MLETAQTVSCPVWAVVRDNTSRSCAITPLTRITLDLDAMGGKPCIRGLRVTVGTLVGLVAAGRTIPEILAACL
jgi:hypothetical protein